MSDALSLLFSDLHLELEGLLIEAREAEQNLRLAHRAAVEAHEKAEEVQKVADEASAAAGRIDNALRDHFAKMKSAARNV